MVDPTPPPRDDLSAESGSRYKPNNLVDPTRLELVTFSMSRKRSNQLSYGSKELKETRNKKHETGHEIFHVTCCLSPISFTWARRESNPHGLTTIGF